MVKLGFLHLLLIETASVALWYFILLIMMIMTPHIVYQKKHDASTSLGKEPRSIANGHNAG